MKSRVRFAPEGGSATVVNRATRSHTFHVSMGNNHQKEEPNEESGFFANLFGLSARKNKEEIVNKKEKLSST
jgi:hypothetical protein